MKDITTQIKEAAEAKKRIKELEAEVKLKRRALEQLEELAAHHEDPEDKSQNQKDWNRVYKVLHTINSPDCRKNHPNWIEEITPQTLRSKL